jgi:hypothetical protein
MQPRYFYNEGGGSGGGDSCDLVISVTRWGEWWRRQTRPRYIYNEGEDYLSAASLHGEICLLPGGGGGEWWRRQMRPRYIFNEGGGLFEFGLSTQ